MYLYLRHNNAALWQPKIKEAKKYKKRQYWEYLKRSIVPFQNNEISLCIPEIEIKVPKPRVKQNHGICLPSQHWSIDVPHCSGFKVVFLGAKQINQFVDYGTSINQKYIELSWIIKLCWAYFLMHWTPGCATVGINNHVHLTQK